MIAHDLPRIVIVTRSSPLEMLLRRHGTEGQAAFHLETRGQSIGPYRVQHERFTACLAQVTRAIPARIRRVRVDRKELHRFVFAPDDIIVIVGQDGLVPNVAKYLDGQLAVGINPDVDRNDGILCPHTPEVMETVVNWMQDGGERISVEHRVMAEVRREDGQVLRALNELFIGHRTHQSARYRISIGGREERQSSSGVICATGTGCTGWAASIARQRGLTHCLVKPEQPRLAWFVREPFPSVSTGTDVDHGILESGDVLTIVSEMGVGGVIFADGIESDAIEFLDGHQVQVTLASGTLKLMMPEASEATPIGAAA